MKLIIHAEVPDDELDESGITEAQVIGEVGAPHDAGIDEMEFYPGTKAFTLSVLSIEAEKPGSLPGEVLWRVTMSPDTDSGDGIVNVVVTPVVNGTSYGEAACGMSVSEADRADADVLGLIEQATERLLGLRALADDLRIIDKYDYDGT